MVVTNKTELPKEEELTVQEINLSTPYLLASAFHLGVACRAQNNEMVINGPNSNLPPNAENVTVQDCKLVTIEPNALKSISNLRRVEISNIDELRLKSESLATKEMDLMRFKKVKKFVAEAGAFRGIERVNKLEFYNVQWDRITNESFVGVELIKHLTFVNLKVDKVDSNAFSHFGYHTENVTLQCCDFQRVDKHGFYIPSPDLGYFNMLESNFVSLASEAFDVKTIRVRVVGNNFPGRLEGSPFKFQFLNCVFEKNIFRLLGVDVFKGLSIKEPPRDSFKIQLNLSENYFYSSNASSMNLVDAFLEKQTRTKKVKAELNVKDNRFSCACRDSQWLFQLQNSEDHAVPSDDLGIAQQFRLKLFNSSVCLAEPNTRIAKMARLTLLDNGGCKNISTTSRTSTLTERTVCGNPQPNGNSNTTKRSPSSASYTGATYVWVIGLMIINLSAGWSP